MTIDLAQFLTGAHKDPNIGKILKNQYRIVELLGQGGMGSVYKGVNIPLRQDVAVKIMEPVIRKQLQQVKRFHVEALATSKLRHPNTVRVFDFGQEDDSTLFLVMEFLEGRTLESVLSNKDRFSCKRALKIFKMVMGSLTEAHSYGIVHRDIKPSNLMLIDMPGAHDFVKVVDFGIAKILQAEGIESGLTKTGMIVGSPEYMSPEQIGGKQVDARTDLYSMGVVMFHMLTGHPPYTGDTPITVMVKQGTEPLPPFPADVLQEMPDGLDELLRKMTEKAPDRRPESAQKVLEALDNLDTPNRKYKPKAVVSVTKPEKTVQTGKTEIIGKAINSMESDLFAADLKNEEPIDDFATKRLFPWAIVIIALIVAGGIGFWLFSRGHQTSPQVAKAAKISGKSVKPVKPVKPVKSSLPVAKKPGSPHLRLAMIKPSLSVRKSLAKIKPVSIKNFSPKIAYKTVVVDSSPAGASIWVRGRKKGVTPGVRIRIQKGKTMSVTIKKSGYKTVRVRLNTRRKHVKITLEPILF